MSTPPKYREERLVDIYILAKAGAPDEMIAKSIQLNPTTFNIWKKKHPAVQYALDRARKGTAEGGTAQNLAEYVYGKLDEKAKDVWDRVSVLEDMENGLERVEKILEAHGVRVRQQLFVHALASTCFNVTRACAMVNVTKDQINKWAQREPEFVAMMEEIQFHKKNFFEQAMMDLVCVRNPAAVIHVNSTINKDRGYGKSIQVEGEINVRHTLVPIDKLGLSLDTLLEIEEAMKALPAEDPVSKAKRAVPLLGAA